MVESSADNRDLGLCRNNFIMTRAIVTSTSSVNRIYRLLYRRKSDLFVYCAEICIEAGLIDSQILQCNASPLIVVLVRETNTGGFIRSAL